MVPCHGCPRWMPGCEKNSWYAACGDSRLASVITTTASWPGLIAPTACFWLLGFHPWGNSTRNRIPGW